jgi:hypothetical protein
MRIAASSILVTSTDQLDDCVGWHNAFHREGTFTASAARPFDEPERVKGFLVPTDQQHRF